MTIASLTNPINPQTKSLLYVLSAEIRLEIYPYALTYIWPERSIQSPPLLIALRADPTIYFEALPVFYRYNYYTIRATKFRGRHRIPAREISESASGKIENLRPG
jgi:hypothetical protein